MFGFISKFDSNGKNFYIVRTKGGVSILTEWEYRKVWGKLPQKQVDQIMILLE